MRTAVCLIGITLILNSCSKFRIAEEYPELDSLENNSSAVDLLMQVRQEVFRIEAQSFTREDINNELNPYDNLGIWVGNAIRYVNLQLEGNAPSSISREEYLTFFTQYSASHPAPNYGVMELNDEIQREFMVLGLELFQGEDVSLSVTQLKYVESVVSSSGALTAESKEVVLRTLTVLKNLKWLSTEVEFDFVDSGWWDCFDDYYSSNLLTALQSWETNPVSTTLAWLGLPGTILGCAGDAIYQAATDPDC